MENIKILLISGRKGVGKTYLIKNIVCSLQKKGYVINNKEYVNKQEDSFCIAEIDKTKTIISTASDNKTIIKRFIKYCKENNLKKGDFIIAPIRNIGDSLREYFINAIGKITSETDFERDIIEIPLGKIYTHKKDNENFKYYINSMYSIAQKILEQEFFNIK